MLRLHPFLLVSSSLCFAVAPAGLAGCGARVEADLPLDDAGTPGVDATADAAPEASPDADAAPTVGLGSACDGVGDNPADCSGTLTCYQGDAQRGDDPTRWPGGYCTRSCQQDSQCTSVGGVCSGGGGFGQGQCLLACKVPTDCRQGYACRDIGRQSPKLACAPTGFVATRGAGVACFQSDDPTGANYLAPPPRTHFGASMRADVGEYSSDEVALSIDDAGHVVVGFNGLSQGGNSTPAAYGDISQTPIAFTESDGPTGPGVAFYSDPYLVVGRDGTFYYSTLGLDGQATHADLLVARSTDHGASWTTVKANPTSDCAADLGTSGQSGPCLDHPWLAIGPDKLDASREVLYAAYLAARTNDFPTVLLRSEDGGRTWGLPGKPGQSLPVFTSNNFTFTNLITPAVDESGSVHLVATQAGAGDIHGSTGNAILYAHSDDGGSSVTASTRVSLTGQPVPFEQAVVAAENGRVHVAYVAGAADGAWDIVLATATDGKTWTRETVNDEPSKCATHFHPALAVDRATSRVYVAWYDGRYAPYAGLVAMSVCDFSADADAGTKRCGPNEAVSDAPFFVTTDRTNLLFLGDYFTLVARPGGDLWAAFGDTREGQTSHAQIAHGQF